uniref:Ribosomal protein L21 n=2 Tax=Pan TaxID=9596 RepID=A0A2I3T4L5_PANTR
MTNTKGKRRGTRYMFSRPFRKHGVVRNGYCSKRNAPQVLPWQNWKSLQCYPACCWHCCKQTS